MAKKKGKELTLEEKLEEALVPKEEWPYEVPKNWCWVRLGALLTEIKNGTTIKQDKSGTGYSVTRIESLQNQTIDFNRLGSIIDENKIKDTDWYKDGDIALSHINSAEHVGKTALITAEMLPLVHGMNLLRLRFSKVCVPLLFQYYSQCFQYKENVIERINRAVNQVSINQKQISQIEFPFAPIPEQERIIERIESLFAKLDEAKEKVQDVLDESENRKAAILHKAFSGELTEKWRKENGVKTDSWKRINVSECITTLSQGWSPKCNANPSENEETWGVIKTTAIQHMKFDETENKELPDTLKPREKHVLKTGDILITRAGPRVRVGVCCLVPNVRRKLLLCDKAYRFQTLEQIMLAEFFVAQMNTPKILDTLNNMKTGISDSGLNLTQDGFRSIKVVCPSISEQKEVMYIVNRQLRKEQQIKDQITSMLKKIEMIKKSILAKAFRGELGTNDSSETSSIELLKEIL